MDDWLYTDPNVRPVAVFVRAQDPLTALGARTALAAEPCIRLLPPERSTEAETLLVMASSLDEQAVRWMRAAKERNRRLRVVLVADDVPTGQLVHAVDVGLIAVLLRAHASPEQLVVTLARSRVGNTQLPQMLVRSLLSQLRAQQGYRSSRGYDRELDVLRLLADGLSTRDIALQLNYSERTIKHAIQRSCARWGLRNRTQAVAHAVRLGVI